LALEGIVLGCGEIRISTRQSLNALNEHGARHGLCLAQQIGSLVSIGSLGGPPGPQHSGDQGRGARCRRGPTREHEVGDTEAWTVVHDVSHSGKRTRHDLDKVYSETVAPRR
jgi:hypothetical protein